VSILQLSEFPSTRVCYLCAINTQDEIRSLLQELRKEKPVTRQEEILYLVNVMGYTKEEAEEILSMIETEKPNME
jgi:hypothetical protein